MGVTEELERARGLLASGDISGLLRHLRAHGEALPLGEVARLVAGAAQLAGFADLAQAAAAVAEGEDGSGTEDARALYDFGYACIERGVAYLAVRPLARALGLPTTDFDPGKPAGHSLVVAYDLTETDPSTVAALRERAPGQVLFERATCWTDPPRVTADVSGLLGQTVVPPWATQIAESLVTGGVYD